MADDLVGDFMKVELEKERVSILYKLCKAILSKELTLLEIVEKLGPYLTNPDPSERCKGTQLLSMLLHQLVSFKLLEREVIILVEFFCDRMKDHFSVIPHVFSGLLALTNLHKIPDGSASKIVQALFKEIHVQSLLQADRHNVYSLISVLIDKKMTELQKLGGDFVFGYIQTMDGEKDPRNLLLCFKLVQVIVKKFPIALLAEDLFEVTSCYFTIDFTPPPNDPNAVTREQLILALRKCLASTSIFAPFCLPLLIEKISSEVIYAKKDALLTLAACADVYDSRFISEYLETLWKHIKKEFFITADQSVEVACLKAIQSLVRNISVAEERNPTGNLNDLLTKIFDETKGNLSKPYHKLMKTSASLLQNVALASDMVCANVVSVVVPILLEQFEAHKQISHQKAILDAMLGFLQVAKDFEGKDTTSCLMKFKDDLLGLLISLLINHSPLHRSSGIAGLVAMVASGILVETEVVSFLSHLVGLILDDDEKIVRHEAKLALAYLSSQFPALVRCHVIVKLTERLNNKEITELMDKENEDNKVPERSHVTHEYLVTTLATLCNSQGNVEYILPRLLENLTTLWKEKNITNETAVICLVDCLINILEDCVKNALQVLDYYKDVIFLRVLNLVVVNSLEFEKDEEYGFTLIVLEKFSKLLRNISSKISEGSCEKISSIICEILVDGNLDRVEMSAGLRSNAFDVLDWKSPNQQTQLVMFLTSVLCNIPKKFVNTRTHDLCSRLISLAVQCRHRRTNIEASKCLAGLINRIPDGDKVQHEVRKCLASLEPLLDKHQEKDEKWRATIALIWMTKALLIREHSLALNLTTKLLDLFNDDVVGQCAADGFYVIMSESDDVMVNTSCANIKMFYKQRVFIQVSPMLTKLFQSCTKDSGHLYLRALSHLMNSLPKQVLLAEIPTLLPLLVQSLSCDESNLQLSTLETFYSFTHDIPKIVCQYITSLVPRYINLAQNAPTLKLRCMSLKCLGVLTVLPHHEVYPYKNEVIKSLSKCLDDHKRLVRKEAVQCRNEWFLLGASTE